MGFRDQHPMDIVTKCIMLEQLRTIKPELIAQVNKDFVIEVEIIDGGKDEIIKYEIDWEYALFTATNYQIEKLFSNFVPKKKEKK